MIAARAARHRRPAVAVWLVAAILIWSAGCGVLVRPARGQSWTDKLTTTPSLVQTDFGRFGSRLPFNGEISCGETAIAMSLLWLGENGFTQVAPATATQADALALVRLFTGMAEGGPAGFVYEEPVPTVPFTGVTHVLPPGDFIQTDVPLANPSAPVLAVLETGYALTIDPSARPGRGWTPQPFALEPQQYINNFRAPLEVLAPLEGAGGLYKLGPADLILTGSNTTTGANSVLQGLLVSGQASGTPFGTGSLYLANNGGLALRPDAAHPGDVRVAVASGSGNTLTYGPGARLVLDRGAPRSLEVTVGGNTDGASPNVVRGPGGTVTVRSEAGLDRLGASERVLIAGTAGNLPPVTHGMVNPSAVGEAPGAGRRGGFLTYGAAGLAPARTTSSRDLPLVFADATTVYALDSDQFLRGGEAASVYALQAGPHVLAPSPLGAPGPTALRVGSSVRGEQAGLILNGASISTTSVDFGASEGLIYTSLDGGTIFGDIRGRGGLTLFGPGTLQLWGTNEYAGPTFVNTGTVVVRNRRGSGLGVGDVTINAGGSVTVKAAPASVPGSIQVSQDSFLVLRGGTVGPVTVDSGDLETGGVLEGHGTVNGPATIYGTVRSGPAPGILTFMDTAFFQGAVFSWTLTALDDDPARRGEAWNALDFRQLGIFGTGDGVFVLLNFQGIPDPDSDHPFWRRSHQWVIAQFSRFYAADNVFWVNAGNLTYRSGTFQPDKIGDQVVLTYTPK